MALGHSAHRLQHATKPELVGHFAPEYPDFNLLVPDQVRFEIFEQHLKRWIADREQGKDSMPSFMQLRFPNDHTAGTTRGAQRLSLSGRQ